MTKNPTWESRTELSSEQATAMIGLLIDSGLPMNYDPTNSDFSDDISPEGAEADEAESKVSIVVFASVDDSGVVNGRFFMPSGLVYDLKSDEFEFWNFAFRHHYIVTGNGADRRFLAAMYSEPKQAESNPEDPLMPKRINPAHDKVSGFCAPFEYKKMKGRSVLRAKSLDLSLMSVDAMIELSRKLPAAPEVVAVVEEPAQPRQRRFF